MKFKIDECLPHELCERFRKEGHDVQSVHAENLTGADDCIVIAAARREDRILVTLDVRLANIRRKEIEAGPGIVLVRLVKEGRRAASAAISRAIPVLQELPFAGRVVVVTETRVRVRR